MAKRREEKKGLEKAGVFRSRNLFFSEGLNSLKEAILQPGRGEAVATMYLYLPQLPCFGSKHMSELDQNV